MKKSYATGHLSGKPRGPEPGHMSREDQEAAFATIAPDTRTWQQKFMGDPTPGRSALGREPDDHRTAKHRAGQERG
jgi:hypothetical protein